MERVTKALLVLSIFLVAFLAGSEGGRDFSTEDEKVYNPQAFFPGLGGYGDSSGGGYGGGSGLFPWLHWFRLFFPWLWGGSNHAQAEFKDMAKGENRFGDVPIIDGKAGHGYP